MKDKELRQQLVRVGVLDGDETYSYNAMRILKHDYNKDEIGSLKEEIKSLRKEIHAQDRKLSAIMELLGITENKEPEKHELVKGKKSASLAVKVEVSASMKDARVALQNQQKNAFYNPNYDFYCISGIL